MSIHIMSEVRVQDSLLRHLEYVFETKMCGKYMTHIVTHIGARIVLHVARPSMCHSIHPFFVPSGAGGDLRHALDSIPTT